MELPFDKIYVLHLPTDITRVNNVKQLLEKISNITVFNSIYIPKVYNIANLLKNNNMFFWNGLGNGTALACTINHYTIIKQAYEEGSNSILILEDDISYNDEYFYVFNNLPNDWDCIRFCWVNNIQGNIYYPNKYEYFTKSKLATWGTQCYALNRKGMKYYLDSMNNNFAVADNPLFTLLYTDLKQYYCNINVFMTIILNQLYK